MLKQTVPIESIQEIRSGEDIRYTREQLHLADEYQDLWFSIIYILDGNYKTLHLIAGDQKTFDMWNNTLRALFAIRQELMRGLGNGEMRQALWEKQYWKTADEEPDHKLSFTEIEGLCKKLNINTNREDLLRMFKVWLRAPNSTCLLRNNDTSDSKLITTNMTTLTSTIFDNL